MNHKKELLRSLWVKPLQVQLQVPWSARALKRVYDLLAFARFRVQGLGFWREDGLRRGVFTY